MHRYALPVAGLLLAAPTLAQHLPDLPTDQARLEIIYRLTYRPDSTAPATRTEPMRLQVGSALSRFESLYSLRTDSVVQAVATMIEARSKLEAVPVMNLSHVNFKNHRSSFREVVYKLPAAGQLVLEDRMGPGRYAYTEPSAPLRWTLLPDTARRAGYPCQRAAATYAGRTWLAWFTRAVPVAEGPYKFGGLPGLVVHLADTRGHFAYELVRLRQLPAPQPAIQLPQKSTQLLSKAAFGAAKADDLRSSFARMLATGAIRFATPAEEAAYLQKGRERAKRPTNPIELK